jgi:hypothetical protein
MPRGECDLIYGAGNIGSSRPKESSLRAAVSRRGRETYSGLVVIPRRSVIRPRDGRVPVTSGPRLIEFAGLERVRCLLQAPNARAVRKPKTQAIVAIVLEPYGEDSRVHERDGNPQKLSHNNETAENPNRVWTFKKLEPV